MIQHESGTVSDSDTVPTTPDTTPDSSTSGSEVPRLFLPVLLIKILFLVGGVFLFVLSLQLLREGASIYSSQIRGLFITSNLNALGIGWFLAYIFLSGSPVAAIAISLFASESINAVQTLLMIVGSRFGASFIVLFVGFIYYLRGHQRAGSIAIGVLAFLTTVAIYVPAALLSYGIIVSDMFAMWTINDMPGGVSFIDDIYSPILHQLRLWSVPGWGMFMAGVAVLIVSFKFLDSALPDIHPEQNAFQHISRLIYRPMAMFVLGALITILTLSVSVSLAILVPLSAKGIIRRENSLPYIMGANITTFIDTFVAALSIGGSDAFMIVFVKMGSVAFISLIVLMLFYRPFKRITLYVQEKIINDNRTLALFLCVMLIIPVTLLFIG